MVMRRRTWGIIIGIATMVVDVLKFSKDKFKNRGKRNDCTRSGKKE